jgi:hypothetical protein
VLLALAFAASLRAHQLPVEIVAYVKAEATSLRVLVRVPAAVLADARLPVRADGYLDLAAIENPMAVVASYVARTLDVTRDDRPLPPPRASWTVARAADASFDSYETAAAHFAAARLPADAAVDPDTALVDLNLEYSLRAEDAPEGSASRYSIRVNDFHAPNREVEMRVQPMLDSSRQATLVTAGPPRRVVLNPGWQSVLAMFGRLGLDRIASGANHALFLLCLAIPRRPMRSALSLLGLFAAAFLASLILVTFASDAVNQSRPLALQGLAAGVLIVTALQSITAPRDVWFSLGSAAFGIVDGALFAYAYRSMAPLAGGHTLLSIAAFTVPVLVASLWLLLIVKVFVGFVYRTSLPERWAAVLLAAVPVHTGLHGMGLL